MEQEVRGERVGSGWIPKVVGTGKNIVEHLEHCEKLYNGI